MQSSRKSLSHEPSGRLPLLSTRTAVTFSVKEITLPLDQYHIILLGDTGTQGHYAMVPGQDSNPRPVNRNSVVLPISPPCRLYEYRWPTTKSEKVSLWAKKL